MKQDIYKRFEFIEKHLPIYWSELYKLMERSEEWMLQKMKEVKEIVDSTMVTNFRQVDERMDQFSELVDINLDNLWWATTDNREVFVSIINKVNDDFITKHTTMVEDLEAIVWEISEAHWLIHVAEKKGDENIKEVRKALIEYEAFVNSAVMNEKAARSVMTNQLA